MPAHLTWLVQTRTVPQEARTRVRRAPAGAAAQGISGGAAAGQSNSGGGDRNAAGSNNAAGSFGGGGTAGKSGTGGGSGTSNVGGRDASVVAVDSGLTGANGVWENVTPKGISLDAKLVPADNFGVMDVLADPAHPGMFYAFVCYQGVWRSVDWGATWTKVDTDNNLEQGRPWGEAIAPDGSYMLASTGYGTARWGAWKSIDGGATWAKYPIADNSDPYMFDIDPSDKNHVISRRTPPITSTNPTMRDRRGSIEVRREPGVRLRLFHHQHDVACGGSIRLGRNQKDDELR